MAIMIPEMPREFTPNSLEDQMFEALKQLPDDYIVVHSFHILSVSDQTLHESEADFVILNRSKGLLVLEAKASKAGINYQNGKWYYGSGIEMSHDGPYIQASKSKHNIMKLCQRQGLGDIVQRCKFLSAVWFPTIDRESLNKIQLPPDADIRLTLTMEALRNPKPYLESIMNLEIGGTKESGITAQEEEKLLKNIICPQFQLTPSVCLNVEQKRFVFNRMLKEQSRLLDYLDDQPSGVINGAAGTGKTMLAVEMARRYAARNERVLFLCFNSFLKEHLKEYHSDEHALIDYYTIDGFACKMTKSARADFEQFQLVLMELDEFPYEHVIIDEGQDFGQDRIEESDIIQVLSELVLDRADGKGTFYIFYDRNQLIQSSRVPDYILNADCRLTLYQNCRNTKCIAETSQKVFTKPIKSRSADHCLRGEEPIIRFVQSGQTMKELLSLCIDSCWNRGYKDIAILSLTTEKQSSLSEVCENGFYSYQRKKIPFTTVRKFKGLEADAIILVDVTGDIWEEGLSRLFYVGTSRARFSLQMICGFTEQECKELIKKYKIPLSSRNPYRNIAAALRAMCT